MSHNERAMKACPHCQNTIGFVFGTCCQCGWNYLENRFKFVTVWYPEANGVDPELIAIHAGRTYRAPVEPTPPATFADKSGTFADTAGKFGDTKGTFADPALLASHGIDPEKPRG